MYTVEEMRRVGWQKVLKWRENPTRKRVPSIEKKVPRAYGTANHYTKKDDTTRGIGDNQCKA